LGLWDFPYGTSGGTDECHESSVDVPSMSAGFTNVCIGDTCGSSTRDCGSYVSRWKGQLIITGFSSSTAESSPLSSTCSATMEEEDDVDDDEGSTSSVSASYTFHCRWL